MALLILDSEALSALARPHQDELRHQRVRSALHTAHIRITLSGFRLWCWSSYMACSPLMGCDVRHLGAEGGGVGAGFGGVRGAPGGSAGFAVGWDGLPARGGVGDVRDVAGRTLPGRRVVAPLASGDCHLPYYLTVECLRDCDMIRQRRV